MKEEAGHTSIPTKIAAALTAGTFGVLVGNPTDGVRGWVRLHEGMLTAEMRGGAWRSSLTACKPLGLRGHSPFLLPPHLYCPRACATCVLAGPQC